MTYDATPDEPFHPKQWAGYRAHRRNKIAGGYVVVVDGIAAMLDTDAGRWQTICDPHGWVLSHERQIDAMALLREPETWCERCMEIVEPEGRFDDENPVPERTTAAGYVTAGREGAIGPTAATPTPDA